MNKKTIFLIFFGIVMFLVFFLASAEVVGKSVEEKCLLAKQNYQGNCVEALILLLDDESVGFELRNSAIWALGQLGDIKALPALEEYYTGDIPKKEQIDKVISQHELKKAIKLVSGGVNIGAFVWR